MEKIIDEYRKYLYQLGYSEQRRRECCSQVQVFLTNSGNKAVTQVCQQDIKDFYSYLLISPGRSRRGGGLQEITINGYMYSVQQFFIWLEITGQISYNPASGIKFIKCVKNRRHPISRDQVNALFAAATGNLQQLALLHLCYSCGLRRKEIELLDERDVHFKSRLLYVRKGKGGKRRVIPLTRQVAEELEQYYLESRSELHAKHRRCATAFMLNTYGTRLRGNRLTVVFNQIKAGVQETLPAISLHHMRHSIATHLLQSGMAMDYVRSFLGHSSLDTTQHYAKASMEQFKLKQSV